MIFLKDLLLILSFCLLLITQASCTPKHDKPLNSNLTNENLKTSLSFQKIRDEILKPHCIDCHTDRHNAYENYSLVKLDAQKILSRINGSGGIMPPASFNKDLSQGQISQLTEWIQAGAPEFATDEEASNDNNTDNSTEEFLGFAEIKEQILTPKCVGCHSHYDDYNVVKKELGSIVSFIMSDKMPFPKMPNKPVQPLELPLKMLLTKWINADAPFTQDRPNGPGIDTLTLKPNWISLRNNVFGPKCIVCHNSFGARGPIAFGTFFELRKAHLKDPKLLNFDEPEKSRLIGSIIGRVDPDNNEFFFDPMPFNNTVDDLSIEIPPVTPEEIEVIKEWIKLKLPDQ